MARLIALGAFGDLLPLQTGDVTCTEVMRETLFCVAPYRGQHKAVSAALKAQLGLSLPAAGRRKIAGDAICQWIGHDAWVVSAPVMLDGLAAVSDQSDGYAALDVAGAGVEAVLARLIPLDLRSTTFKVNHTARSLLGHVPVSITRTGAQAFEVMVMRSMAASLVHDLQVAMSGLARRGSA
ncbi:sarcosine oxidase subunit gamma [Yoonia vestfoldensis]|uniref:sarcosine oxidase subunit gamma n=1 Tax=Yoonia vestfoldensis TaxID=245188 RepID=UPI00032241AD|nr:sarcosine oxidase subunit gamma family protein [Yoonia vestfoldensis]